MNSSLLVIDDQQTYERFMRELDALICNPDRLTPAQSNRKRELADALEAYRRAHPNTPSQEAGQGLAEYGLILGLIVVLSILAIVFLGTQIRDFLSSIGDNI